MSDSVNVVHDLANFASTHSPDAESTCALVLKAKRGDSAALEAIFARCLPRLRTWARGRLPAAMREHLDTCDLMQDVVLRAIAGLNRFEPRGAGAVDAYLRQGVTNRIRDEIRRVTRRPATVAVNDELPSKGPSPMATLIEMETYRRYKRALNGLKARDKQLVIARVEHGWSDKKIAEELGLSSTPTAGVAARRAVKRLSQAMAH